MELSALLREPVRKLSLRGEMKLPSGRIVALTGHDIVSLRITEGVQDGMLLGSCPSAQAKLTLADPEGRFLLHGDQRGHVFIAGAEVNMFLTLWDPEDERWKERPLGVFYVTDMAGQENSTGCTLQLTDALGCKFDAPFMNDGYDPVTPGSLALAMARQANVEVNADFPGADILLPVRPDFADLSLRGALGALCAACGCFARMDREGKLCITPVRDPMGSTPYLMEAKNALIRKYGETCFGPVRAVRVNTFCAPRNAENAALLFTDEVGILPDQILTVQQNPLFVYGEAQTETLGRHLLNAVHGLYMEKASLLWQGDPALQLGRMVEMRDKRNAVTFTCVTRQVLTFDRGFTMQTECTVRPRNASGAGMIITPSGGIRGASLTGSVHGNVIVDGTLGVTALKSGSITSQYIAAESIDTSHLKAGSVTADKIASAQIRAVHIEGKTITAEQLAAGLITAGSGLVDTGAIGTAQIADGSITAAKIVSLNADVIDAGTLKAERILLVGEDGVIYKINAASSGLSMTELAKDQYKNYLNGTVIVAKSITAAQIAAKTITANEILAGAITAAEIAANAITSEKLAAHSVTANKLSSDAGSSLDLSSNIAITNLVRDVNALPATYVQFAAPSNVKKGDVWVNTGASTWADLKNVTWQTAKENPWGHYFNAQPVTKVWDGVKWQTVADQAVIKDQYTLITQTQEKITHLATKEELSGKVSQSVFDQKAEELSMRIETVDGKTPEKVVNTALTLDQSGIDMQGGQINIRAGSALTVDAPNFNLDAAGNAVMKNASVSGNLTNNGIAVLTAKNLVVSSTQPTSPVPGMVWVKPVGSTAATFLYNNTTVQSFKAFETAHTLQNAGTAVSASGSYTYNVRIPYKVTGNVNATRYLTMMVGNTAIFTDVALEKTAGTYVLELGGNLSAWLGNSNSLSFTLNLHYMSGDDGTLHNVHRVDVGAIDLRLYAKSNAASGWSSTEVQVYNG